MRLVDREPGLLGKLFDRAGGETTSTTSRSVGLGENPHYVELALQQRRQTGYRERRCTGKNQSQCHLRVGLEHRVRRHRLVPLARLLLEFFADAVLLHAGEIIDKYFTIQVVNFMLDTDRKQSFSL